MSLVRHFRLTTLRGDVFEVNWTPEGLEIIHNDKPADTHVSVGVVLYDDKPKRSGRRARQGTPK